MVLATAGEMRVHEQQASVLKLNKVAFRVTRIAFLGWQQANLGDALFPNGLRAITVTMEQNETKRDNERAFKSSEST
jgi:hypothetical protein